MKFDEAIDSVANITDLRRVANAHVIDYKNLKEDALREAIKKVKPQYTHLETVKNTLDNAFCEEDNLDIRVLSQLIILDVIMEWPNFIIEEATLEEKVISVEQKIIDLSNELDNSDLGGNSKTEHFKNIEFYDFLLGVAWEHRDTKSPDEANLLRKVRNKLKITNSEHRILETRIGKYPKPNNELHSRKKISSVIIYLQKVGILIPIRDDDNNSYLLIPQELAETIREITGKELRKEGFELLLKIKQFKRKSSLQNILKKFEIEFLPTDKIETLENKIIQRIKPSEVLSFLTNDELYSICSELGLQVSGTKDDRIKRIIESYDKIQIRTEGKEEDQRAIYYDSFIELAFRERELLRLKTIIDKDIEIERYFEEATKYLFENRLNHTPLNQPGTNKPDGLISFRDMYLMWDNKSKEKPGLVNLKDHIKQFDGYIRNSDKPVPIFLVVAPSFTDESEYLAITYSAENIGSNIVLITAEELKFIAELWNNEKNKKREEPFPLGLFGNSGRFRKEIIAGIV